MLIISYGMSCILDDLFIVKRVWQYVTQCNSFLYGVIFNDEMFILILIWNIMV
jgi:hypothetical protein